LWLGERIVNNNLTIFARSMIFVKKAIRPPCFPQRNWSCFMFLSWIWTCYFTRAGKLIFCLWQLFPQKSSDKLVSGVKINVFVKKNNHCVQQNVVLMRTGVRFYGTRDGWILGRKIGVPSECSRGENEWHHCKAHVDFSIIHSFAVMILCCANQCKCGLFHQDARWSAFVTWLGQLFILCVLEQDFESSWLWDVNHGNKYMYISLAVFWLHFLISSGRDRYLTLYLVEYCLELLEKYSEGKIHKSGPEPRNNNVNTVYFYSLEEIFKSITTSLLHAIANACLYLCSQLKITYIKNTLLQICFYASTLSVSVKILRTKFEG